MNTTVQSVTVSENDAAALNRLESAMMSGPELYALRMAGYEPIQVVIGVSALSMGARGFGRSIRGIFYKGEMTQVSGTAQEAQQKALQRAREEAAKLGADFLLINYWDIRDVTEIVEAKCVGTACKKVGEPRFMPIATATN